MSRRRIIAIAAVTLAAAMLPLLSFATIITPFDRFPGSKRFQYAAAYLDVPVALLNRALPEIARTEMTLFLRCSHTYCFPDELRVEAARYLRVGFPAYMLLFGVPLAATFRLLGRNSGHERR